jgi:ubiquinone/menaquinone biosynthesis C-methylase UbiE
MKISKLFHGVKAKKYSLGMKYDKTSKERPAWIIVKGLPDDVQFIRIHLGKKGKEGKRIQTYKTYLIDELFLPIDYTKKEMAKFYDKFSKVYDYSIKTGGKGVSGQNLLAAKFLLNKVKRFVKKGEMLDLGAGTGLITEIFVKEGFYPATLVDYSKGMLNKAKKRKSLKGCKFVERDIRKLNLNKKYDLILSVFSFGSDSYFDKEEMDNILKIASKHLKSKGILAVLGHNNLKRFNKYFKKLDSGIYDLSTKNKFYTDYFIGRKK